MKTLFSLLLFGMSLTVVSSAIAQEPNKSTSQPKPTKKKPVGKLPKVAKKAKQQPLKQ
jgi:hypothetical protein